MPAKQLLGIQILRFVAAMLVVIMHTTEAISVRITGAGPDQYWSSGAIGVDIFFVISGFVMAMSTAKLPTDYKIYFYSAWIFMKRRLIRVAPLYWFYTFLKTALVLILPSLALRTSIDPDHLLASLFFIPAISPWGIVQPTLPVGWTLNFEMLFYMLVAAAILLVKLKPTQIAATVLAVVSTTIYTLHIPLYGSAWQLVAPLSLEFSAGVFLAYIFHHHAPKIQNNPLAVFLALILWCGAIYLGSFGRSADIGFDRALTWGISAFIFVFGALLLEKSINFKSIFSRGFTLLGEASYSLYLVHGITFSITWKLSPSFVKDEPIAAAIALFFAAICISIPLHKIVELRLNDIALKLGKKFTEA